MRSALWPTTGLALWGPQRLVLGQVAIHAQAPSHTAQPGTDAGLQLTAPFGKEQTGLILSSGASEAGFLAAHARQEGWAESQAGGRWRGRAGQWSTADRPVSHRELTCTMPLGASSCLLLACTLAIVPFLTGELVGPPTPWPSAHALLCVCTARPVFRHPAPPFSPCIIPHPTSPLAP